MARKKTARPGQSRKVALRDDVREAIERLWPDGVVEMSIDSEESYFRDIYPKLERAFRRVKGARLLHEGEAGGGPIWWEESDPEEDPPDDIEHSRSYHLFFLSPEGEVFTFRAATEELCEPDDLDEEFEEAGWEAGLRMKKVPGEGRTGWSVAVSLLAPFAVITLSELVNFEDGSAAEPAIEAIVLTEDGDKVNLEENFRSFAAEEAFEVLQQLHATIAGMLEKQGIAVLPEAEWRKPVPWLRGGEEVFVGTSGERIRVLDALFFEGL